MLCTHCEGSSPPVTRRTLFALPEAAGEWERLRPLLCARCGSALPAVDLTATMLGKLSQLARFGLVDGSRPLLERATPLRVWRPVGGDS